MWKTFPRKTTHIEGHWEDDQGNILPQYIYLTEFNNEASLYCAIYYDDGRDDYKRTPELALPENPTGRLIIPKNGSYKIGAPTKSIYPPDSSRVGAPCWKVKIKITGGNQEYTGTTTQVWSAAVNVSLPENSMYPKLNGAYLSGARYQITTAEKETETSNAIQNGEIIIPESE